MKCLQSVKGKWGMGFSRCRRAQIAPFLIAIIVVLIVAIMVTVNLGKVALNKTHTANAADAGALAGATVYDQTLNNIAYQNSVMISTYLAAQITFLLPTTICNGWLRFAAWVLLCADLSFDFYEAWDMGDTGYEDARILARQLAFNNAGVDETKPARTLGQTYQDWLKNSKSGFEEFMEDEDNYDNNGDNGSVFYRWIDNVKYGQSASAGENSVEVDAEGPDFPGLIPMPGALWGIFRNGPFSVCVPVCGSCPNCWACSIALTAYYACLTSIGAAAVPVFMLFSQAATYCPSCGGGYYEVSVTGGTVYSNYLTWILPSFVACGGVAYNFIEYTVPIAFIANTPDDPEIEVTVTKREPQINLGLWNMSYDAPSRGPGGGIRSQAKAIADGGSVGPVPSSEYDAYLTEVSE